MASSAVHHGLSAVVGCSSSSSSAAFFAVHRTRNSNWTRHFAFGSHSCRQLRPPTLCVPSGGWQRRRQQSAVCMVLPTGSPVEEGQKEGRSGHLPWSARAIKSFSMSELEARKLKYPTTGTESLLMGILTEGTSHASRFLRACGITLFGVRDQTIIVLGKADMYFFSPEHPPLTEQAQKALDWAIAEKTKKGGDDEVTTSYMLLGIWAQKGSAGQKVLEALGFDDKKAEELLASIELRGGMPAVNNLAKSVLIRETNRPPVIELMEPSREANNAFSTTALCLQADTPVAVR